MQGESHRENMSLEAHPFLDKTCWGHVITLVRLDGLSMCHPSLFMSIAFTGPRALEGTSCSAKKTPCTYEPVQEILPST